MAITWDGRPTVWRVAMPAGMPLLSTNQRHNHWSERQRTTKALRRTAYVNAAAAHIPQLQRARIVAVYHPHDRRRRDVHNLLPAAKACVDGLVDAGVLPDDNDQHLIGPDMRPGLRKVKHGQLVLHVTALDQDAERY